MSSNEAINPFQRGTGSYPPVLAGREAELSALRRLLDRLADRSLEQTIHLMQAPRGLGKTVLLQALQREASVQDGAVDVLRTSAGAFPSLDDLAELASPVAPLPRRILGWFAGLSLFGVRIQQPPRGGSGLRNLEEALDRRSRRPLLLAIDEAHMLPPDVCRVLLNLFQNLAGETPCALLLVGTPALTLHILSPEVGASFAERAPMIVPDLLSPAESIEALRVPQWRGWAVDESVLKDVADDALGYPFFLQLWGEQLWDAGLPRQTVDMQTLEAARQGVEAVRTRFYAARFDEFEQFAVEQDVDRGAFMAALQRIAPAVSGSDATITTRELTDMLEGAGLDPAQAMSAKQCFVDNGFLARVGDDWCAAIPSLATYIRNHPR